MESSRRRTVVRMVPSADRNTAVAAHSASPPSGEETQSVSNKLTPQTCNGETTGEEVSKPPASDDAVALEKAHETAYQTRKTSWRSVFPSGLSASQFGSALGFCGAVYDFIHYETVDKHNEHLRFTGNDATSHGVRTEGEARQLYEFYTGNVVRHGMFWKLAGHPHLGCSPDGIVFQSGATAGAEESTGNALGSCTSSADVGLLEIKCPVGASLYSAQRDGNKPFGIPKTYMCQMQGQMAIYGAKWCDFVVYVKGDNMLTTAATPKEQPQGQGQGQGVRGVDRQFVVYRVLYSTEFWEWAFPKLQKVHQCIDMGFPAYKTIIPDRSYAFDPFDFTKLVVLPLVYPTNITRGGIRMQDASKFPVFIAPSRTKSATPVGSVESTSVAPGKRTLISTTPVEPAAVQPDGIALTSRVLSTPVGLNEPFSTGSCIFLPSLGKLVLVRQSPLLTRPYYIVKLLFCAFRKRDTTTKAAASMEDIPAEPLKRVKLGQLHPRGHGLHASRYAAFQLEQSSIASLLHFDVPRVSPYSFLMHHVCTSVPLQRALRLVKRAAVVRYLLRPDEDVSSEYHATEMVVSNSFPCRTEGGHLTRDESYLLLTPRKQPAAATAAAVYPQHGNGVPGSNGTHGELSGVAPVRHTANIKRTRDVATHGTMSSSDDEEDTCDDNCTAVVAICLGNVVASDVGERTPAKSQPTQRPRRRNLVARLLNDSGDDRINSAVEEGSRPVNITLLHITSLVNEDVAAAIVDIADHVREWALPSGESSRSQVNVEVQHLWVNSTLASFSRSMMSVLRR